LQTHCGRDTACGQSKVLDLGCSALLVVLNGPKEGLDGRPRGEASVRETDASELATLLNEIILRRGTTSLEEPFAPDALARTLLISPEVICCFVAVQRATSR
jgi:hypothetical protein